MRLSFEILQPELELVVLLVQSAEFGVGHHQMRLQFFICLQVLHQWVLLRREVATPSSQIWRLGG
jgi:hypothetical protein